jgi:hypothetical protein
MISPDGGFSVSACPRTVGVGGSACPDAVGMLQASTIAAMAITDKRACGFTFFLHKIKTVQKELTALFNPSYCAEGSISIGKLPKLYLYEIIKQST